MSSSHGFWKRWRRRTWGTLPSTAFSRSLDVCKRPECWEWSHSDPWSLQVLGTHLKFSWVTRIQHTQRFNFKKVFKSCVTSSGFSTDEGLRTADCYDREPPVNDPFGKSLIFCPKIPLGDLILKIIFQGSSEFLFFTNSRKFESAVKVRFFV